MPLYDYQCVDCGAKDQRIGAIDDGCALCVACGGLMLRITDPFINLWDDGETKCQKSPGK
jgi:putative FmdB family regulatory protein